MSISRLQLLGLVALAAILFFFNTWGYDLWPADEPRFGEVPREMMQSGDYLVPRWNGEPYKEKPPLLFWTIVLTSLPFGDVTEFSARAPSGVAALVTVLLTYLLARRLFGPGTGFWSALVLMTMGFFWSEARSVRTDMLLTFWMTVVLCAFWRWYESRRTHWLLVLYGAVTLGLYTKGPVALVFPALFILVFYWRRRQDRRALHWLLGFLMSIGLVLLWFIPARMALPAATETAAGASMGGEMFNQIVGRLVLGVSKAQPPWFYLYNIPFGMLPWGLFLPWTIIYVWKQRREGEGMRLLLAWVIPAFVFFTLSVGKRHVYLLPIYPALAILTARSVVALVETGSARWLKWIGAVWGIVLIALAAAPFAVFLTPYRDVWTPMFIIFSISAFAFGASTLWRAATTDMRRLHIAMAGHFVVLALLAVTFFFPALNAYKGAGGFCRPIRELALRNEDFRLYSIAFSREEYAFYSRHFHQGVLMDAIPVPAAMPFDKKTEIKLQETLRDAVRETGEKARFAEIERPTNDELANVRAAIDGAVDETNVDPGFARAYMSAMGEEVRRFERVFVQTSPAFAFVQREDWRWILPFLQSPSDFVVVEQDTVGSRDMLLLANGAGMDLLAKANGAPPT